MEHVLLAQKDLLELLVLLVKEFLQLSNNIINQHQQQNYLEDLGQQHILDGRMVSIFGLDL